MESFKALVVKEQDGAVVFSVDQITLDQLFPGEVLIKVAYSSVNYKDSLAVKAGGGVIRNYPMIPGIDLSGTVVSSAADMILPGQKVLVTGFHLGMTHTGGLSEYARVPASWIVPLPEGLSLRDAMIIGTAGFTAALSINALEKSGMSPHNNPEVLVTGAAGGVGSIALQLLSKSGYSNVYALCRNDTEKELLQSIGIAKVLELPEVLPEKAKPLGPQKFHHVLDVVGGEVASALIPQIYYGGSMSMCGNAGGIKLNATVLPFILRGIKLLGIDSVSFPIEDRTSIWQRFAQEWNIMGDAIVNEVGFDDLATVFADIQNGSHMGRTIVKIG